MGNCLEAKPRELVFAEAEAKFKNMISEDPTNEEAKFNLAITYFNQGKYDLAKLIWLEINDDYKGSKANTMNHSRVSEMSSRRNSKRRQGKDVSLEENVDNAGDNERDVKNSIKVQNRNKEVGDVISYNHEDLNKKMASNKNLENKSDSESVKSVNSNINKDKNNQASNINVNYNINKHASDNEKVEYNLSALDTGNTGSDRDKKNEGQMNTEENLQNKDAILIDDGDENTNRNVVVNVNRL